jgi:hypothetical protein
MNDTELRSRLNMFGPYALAYCTDAATFDAVVDPTMTGARLTVSTSDFNKLVKAGRDQTLKTAFNELSSYLDPRSATGVLLLKQTDPAAFGLFVLTTPEAPSAKTRGTKGSGKSGRGKRR